MRGFPLGIGIVLGIAIGVQARSAVEAAPSGLAPLEFLLGEWVVDKGKPDEPSGRTTFTWGLQDRVILRTNYADYPASERGPASRHDDLMVIYAGEGEGAGIRADYYDSEGHVIRYTVRVPRPNVAIFVSNAAKGSPRYRLTYELTEAGLQGKFEIAPPGAPEAFSPYLVWKSQRVSP